MFVKLHCYTERNVAPEKKQRNKEVCETKKQGSMWTNSPPQQKPEAPIAEKPLLLKSSITGFDSSNPLSC